MQENYNKKNYQYAPFSKVHLRVYIAICLGQIACGYSLGISGLAIEAANKYLNITSIWNGLIGSGTLIGLGGSIFMGRLADKIGRHHMLMINMYVLSFLSIIQLFTSNLLFTFIIRIGIGLMIAIDYTVGNALLIEWMPIQEGAKKQSSILLYWTLGFVISYPIGLIIHGFGPLTWRIILASGAFFSLIAALYRTSFNLPGSPSWLASRGNFVDANKIIQYQLGKKWGLPKHLERYKPIKSLSWTELFNKHYLRRTIVGGGFYACQSFAYFGISIFLPLILKSMNLQNNYLPGIIYNIGIFVGVSIGVVIFNHIGRKIFLTSTFLISAISIGLLALSLHANAWIKVVLFLIFAMSLSSGLVFDYTYTTELFDVKIRATGVGTCIAISRIGAFLGTFLLPIINQNYGTSTAMFICFIVLVFGTLICGILAIETAALSK